MADTRKNYTEIRATEYNNTSPFDTRFRSEGYNVGAHSYPEGLGISPDLQHYVTFFINVRGKSQFVRNGNYAINNNVNPTPIAGSSRNNIDLNGKLTGAVFGGAVAAGVTAVGAASIGMAKNLMGLSNKSTSAQGPQSTSKSIGQGVRTAGAKVLGFAVLADLAKDTLQNTKVLETDKTRRLKDVITLHMQERPAVSYGINYQDRDLGILGGFLGVDTAASESIAADRRNGLMTSLGLQLAKLPSILPGLGNPADAIQLGAKVKTNPFREVFFEGIDYRKFNFRYKFMPKSKSEVTAVYNIIEKFKEHMHPEIAGGGAFFLYPSEFEIAYYYNNKENKYFNKIATCALTDMSVEYGGEQFSSFADGAPTEINLTLSFRELELITKETIKSRGY